MKCAAGSGAYTDITTADLATYPGEIGSDFITKVGRG